MSFEFKERYTINDLVSIMELLRSPDGCPWDRKQDHNSIRSNLIEETYEVLDAIDNRDTENLKEELGDLLLQVVFHSRMEEEIGNFSFDDVCNDICQKLVIRHPHVFADVTAETPEDVLRTWDEVKAKTKGQKKTSEGMLSIPKGLPALIRAVKVQKKAANVGFDWDDLSGAYDKLEEELIELREAVDQGSQTAVEDELGDVLFSVVNVSRFVKTDAEAALSHACDKFVQRFVICEQLANERGVNMKQASIDELDELWDEAKERLAH